jgi:hypothetical protein
LSQDVLGVLTLGGFLIVDPRGPPNLGDLLFLALSSAFLMLLSVLGMPLLTSQVNLDFVVGVGDFVVEDFFIVEPLGPPRDGDLPTGFLGVLLPLYSPLSIGAFALGGLTLFFLGGGGFLFVGL